MMLTSVAIAGTLGAGGVKVYLDKKKREREKPWTVALIRMAKNQPLKYRKRRAPVHVTVFEGAQKVINPFKRLSVSGIFSDTRQEQLKEISATGQIEVSDAQKKNNPKPRFGFRLRQPVGIFDKSPKSLIEKLAPDRFVPNSRKVQSKLLVADRSPWKQQVLVEQSTTMPSLTEKVKTQLRDLPLFAHYVRTYWSPYAVAGVVGVVGLMSPILYRVLFFSQGLKTITDSAFVVGGGALIKGTLIKMAVGVPVTIAMSTLGYRLMSRLRGRMANDIRADLFAHLQSLPPAFHQEAKLSDLVARFSSDIDRIEEAMGRQLLLGVGDFSAILFSFGLMLRIQWQLSLLTLLPLIAMTPLMLRTAGLFAEASYGHQTQKGFMLNAVREGLTARPLAESFGLQRFMQTCFGDELKKFEDQNTKSSFSRGLFYESVTFTYLLLELVALAGGAFCVLSGTMTVGTLLAFVTIATTFYMTFDQLANVRMYVFIDALASIRRLHEVFQHSITTVEAEDAIVLPAFREALRFSQATFSYNGHGATPQLSDINLTIAAGQFVAFVGPSGAGKSTIFNLLMRFYDVTEGRITIDGHDLRDVTQASLRRQMGVVLQDTILFNTTIYDNIRVVKPDATEAEVIAASKAAQLHDFVMSLPDGYDSPVGEAGGRLSGGQKQRIGIARALLYNPPILLLDEPTSSLDVETAAAINRTVENLVGQRTVIMITHYLPAVVNADRIFVLKEGRLVEQGTHSQLLARNEVYQQLADSQNHAEQQPPKGLRALNGALNGKALHAFGRARPT